MLLVKICKYLDSRWHASDIERYKPMVAEFLENGKAIASEIVRDASASIPFTQGQRDDGLGLLTKQVLLKIFKASLRRKK